MDRSKLNGPHLLGPLPPLPYYDPNPEKIQVPAYDYTWITGSSCWSRWSRNMNKGQQVEVTVSSRTHRLVTVIEGIITRATAHWVKVRLTNGHIVTFSRYTQTSQDGFCRMEA